MLATKTEYKNITDGSYTQPLGFRALLKSPVVKLDILPILDILVIALLFGLLFSRFAMVPGVRIDLPNSELKIALNNLPVAVLTVGNGGTLFFNGSVFELDSIDRGFKEYHLLTKQKDVVLFVKTEGTMDLQLFLRLCQMAQDAGFVQVQIAGEYVSKSQLISPSAGDIDIISTNELIFDM